MSYKILLADDSVTVQKIVTLTFSDEGVDVVPVSDGTEAITRLQYMRPALVMADVSLPGRNGFEICEFVKSHPDLKNTPVILLVPAFEPFDHERAIRVGADHHLTKPFQSIRALIATVRRLIETEPKSTDVESIQWPATVPPPTELPDQSAPRITADAQIEDEPFAKSTANLPSTVVAPLPQASVSVASLSLESDELLELTATNPDTGDLALAPAQVDGQSSDELSVEVTPLSITTDLAAQNPEPVVVPALAQPVQVEPVVPAVQSQAIEPVETVSIITPPPLAEPPYVSSASVVEPALSEPSLNDAATHPVNAQATVVVLPSPTTGKLAPVAASHWATDDFDDLLELDDVLPSSNSQPLSLTMLPAPFSASATTVAAVTPLPIVEHSITQSLRVTAVEAVTTVPQNIIDEIVARVTTQVSTQFSAFFQQFAAQMAQDLAPRIAQEVLTQINNSKPNSLPAKD